MLEHIQKSAEEVAARVVAHRRTLHQIPEVGLELPQTADYVRKVLTELGYRPENIGISGWWPPWDRGSAPCCSGPIWTRSR